MELVERHLTSWARELLDATPVLVIEGARQVGKSTLAAMLSPESAVLTTMDDELTRTFASDDPAGFLASAGDRRLVVDEIQRCPELILPLKAAVDRDRTPGRFILTGSANLLRLPGAEDSLAGRAMTIRVHPFTQGELAGHRDDWVTALTSGPMPATVAPERDEVIDRITRGGYPPVQTLSGRVRTAWLDDYADRLLERDSADLGPTQLPVLRNLLRIITAAPGGEIVWERLADALGVARATVSRHLDILEGLFLVERLPSWSRNLTNRQVGRTKAYVSDTGLAAALSRLAPEHLRAPHGADHLGPLLENFVVIELLRQQGWSSTPYTLSHYRDRNGAEVDVIIETPRGVIGVEVKSTSTARSDHFKHLISLRERLGPEFVAGVVLSLGSSRTVGDRLHALPVSSLWDH
ncbi:MAG: ATP-binding protein [Propionibacteriaceae bacterium]|nr:ATP-binding protein [Propionibacteriaceae bacterium]